MIGNAGQFPQMNRRHDASVMLLYRRMPKIPSTEHVRNRKVLKKMKTENMILTEKRKKRFQLSPLKGENKKNL